MERPSPASTRRDGDSLEMLFALPPKGWSSWDAHRTHEYKAAIGDLHRAETLPKVIECARRLAPFYGLEPQALGLDG